MTTTAQLVPNEAGFRPAVADDAGFLYDLYADTRVAEFAALPPELAEELVRLQYRSRATCYAAAYDDLVEEILEKENGRPVGRILLSRTPDELRVVDIAVLRAERGQGIATRAIRRWSELAARAGLPLGLTVFTDNPALALYRRLGFSPVGSPEAGRVDLMLEPRASHEESLR